MNREPILPRNENGWSKDANAYRTALHESLYPKGQTWVPVKENVTASSTEAEYTAMGRLWFFSIVFQGPTSASAGAYLDLPFSVSQYSVFSVAVGGAMKAATVAKGSNRLYLPEWTPSGQAVISGIAVG